MLAALGACSSETETATENKNESKSGNAGDDQALCVLERAAELVGMDDPSDEQIMAITGASRVRRALDGEPMTMELLPFRATVILDPESRKVISANCS
ncbi:MAG: hypothetical protein KDJ80_01525 [Nitratireductor sp.]|nr:hypothetical protein [Nitratireductor sp.]